MKRLIKFLFIVACIVAAWNFIPKKEANIPDLMLENIEALANGEGSSGTWCFGSGTIECFGQRVDMRIDNYSAGI
jgi:hypothetical protein